MSPVNNFETHGVDCFVGVNTAIRHTTFNRVAKRLSVAREFKSSAVFFSHLSILAHGKVAVLRGTEIDIVSAPACIEIEAKIAAARRQYLS